MCLPKPFLKIQKKKKRCFIKSSFFIKISLCMLIVPLIYKINKTVASFRTTHKMQVQTLRIPQETQAHEKKLDWQCGTESWEIVQTLYHPSMFKKWLGPISFLRLSVQFRSGTRGCFYQSFLQNTNNSYNTIFSAWQIRLLHGTNNICRVDIW